MNNTVLSSPCNLTDPLGNKLSASILTLEISDLMAYGIKYYVEDSYDSRYYNLLSTYLEEGYDTWYLRKNLENKYATLTELKNSVIKDINLLTFGLLSPTDWIIVRYAENGDAIPTSVSDKRDLIRSNCDAETTAINNLTDYDEVAEYDYRSNFVTALSEAEVKAAENVSVFLQPHHV